MPCRYFSWALPGTASRAEVSGQDLGFLLVSEELMKRETLQDLHTQALFSVLSCFAKKGPCWPFKPKKKLTNAFAANHLAFYPH